MKLNTKLNFKLDLYTLDFLKEYYPEINDFSKIQFLDLNEFNLLTFTYEWCDYELPLVDKQSLLKVLDFLWAIRYTDDNLNIYFKTKSWNIFTIPLEDFSFIKWDVIDKIKKILDDN